MRLYLAKIYNEHDDVAEVHTILVVANNTEEAEGLAVVEADICFDVEELDVDKLKRLRKPKVIQL